MSPEEWSDWMRNFLGEEQFMAVHDAVVYERLRSIVLSRWPWIVGCSDDQVIRLYSQIPDIGNKLEKFRRMAVDDHQYHGVIAYEIRPGFSFLKHGWTEKCVPPICIQNDYTWRCFDKPTKSSLALWVPRLIGVGLDFNVPLQKEMLLKIRERFQLPEHYLSRFGTVAELVALSNYHLLRTGEPVPLNGQYTRTDTVCSRGDLLNLGEFRSNGFFNIMLWRPDFGFKDLGCYPLAIEPLE